MFVMGFYNALLCSTTKHFCHCISSMYLIRFQNFVSLSIWFTDISKVEIIRYSTQRDRDPT